MLLDKFNAGRQCLDDFMEDASKDLLVGRLRVSGAGSIHILHLGKNTNTTLKNTVTKCIDNVTLVKVCQYNLENIHKVLKVKCSMQKNVSCDCYTIKYDIFRLL